jgi:hypothetical protein
MTVTFFNVPTAHGRVFPLGNYRRFVNGIVIGLGTVVAVCVLVIIVTVAAAWIIKIALATNHNIHALAPIEPGTMALAKYDSTLAADAFTSQPDFRLLPQMHRKRLLRPNGLARWLPRRSAQ